MIMNTLCRPLRMIYVHIFQHLYYCVQEPDAQSIGYSTIDESSHSEDEEAEDEDGPYEILPGI